MTCVADPCADLMPIGVTCRVGFACDMAETGVGLGMGVAYGRLGRVSAGGRPAVGCDVGTLVHSGLLREPEGY